MFFGPIKVGMLPLAGGLYVTEHDEPDADDAMGSDGAALAQEHGPAAQEDPKRWRSVML